jgi:hypothetical protein
VKAANKVVTLGKGSHSQRERRWDGAGCREMKMGDRVVTSRRGMIMNRAAPSRMRPCVE